MGSRKGPRSSTYRMSSSTVPYRTGRTRTAGFYGRYSGSTAPEKKFFDVKHAAVTLTTGGVVTDQSLNLIDQGNDECQMIGRKVVIKSFMIRGIMRFPQQTNAVIGSVNAADTCRFALVLDKQCNGATATVALMYQNTDIWTFNNLENSSRFSILKEWKMNIGSSLNFNDDANVYFSGDVERQFKYFKKCNIPLEFGIQSGGSRVITEVKSNNLFLIGFSHDGKISVEYRTRIRYADA